ncbi:MAG: XisH family protein [Cyanobacteria bacterium P01_F01_bin.150]
MAKDLFHSAVKTALQKEGWIITHDPYDLAVGGVEMHIDLGAELLGAERNGTKIAVEVKSFVGHSAITEFHAAHGQYLDYRYALETEDPDRLLYLAISEKVYEEVFGLKFIESVVERSQIKRFVYDPQPEVMTPSAFCLLPL